jgi:hypothetical protein
MKRVLVILALLAALMVALGNGVGAVPKPCWELNPNHPQWCVSPSPEPSPSPSPSPDPSPSPSPFP